MYSLITVAQPDLGIILGIVVTIILGIILTLLLGLGLFVARSYMNPPKVHSLQIVHQSHTYTHNILQVTKTFEMYLDRNGYTQSIKKYADKYVDRWPNTHYPIQDAMTSAHPLAE